MDSTALKMAYSAIVCRNTSDILAPKKTINFGINLKGSVFNTKICAIPPNGSASSWPSHEPVSSSAADEHRCRSNLESLFCYDKSIPEERIEKPIGLSLAEKAIGDDPDALVARPKVQCFVLLVLVQAYMLMQLWKAKASLSKFAV